jgi:succinyl-CoA synthetase beta subunit
MRCDYIAEGVIKATRELDMKIPLVVRLKGTKEAEAKQYVAAASPPAPAVGSQCLPRMIKDSGMKIVAFDELDDAAQKAVELATA